MHISPLLGTPPGPLSWHGPPIMTHYFPSHDGTHSLTCPHCGTNTPPSGTLPHVLPSQYLSSYTPAGGQLHIMSFSPNICTTFHPNQMAPAAQPLLHRLLRDPPGSQVPNAGGGAVVEGCAFRVPAGGAACCLATAVLATMSTVAMAASPLPSQLSYRLTFLLKVIK